MAPPKVKFTITAPPFVGRDGKTYMVVRSGCIVDHVRIYGDTDAATELHRRYGVTLAVAKRLLAAAVKKAAAA